MKDLHILPRVSDSWSYLYVERAHIDQEHQAIAIVDESGRTPVPCAMFTTIMLGPGTTITHIAVKTLADCGCLVIWSGEEGVRFYAEGMGETRSSKRIMHQARLWADPEKHLEVVRRLYQMRFPSQDTTGLTLEQMRGLEGIRVRESYRRLSAETGVSWSGRSYKAGQWKAADPVNRAISAANSCLYGVCHAAIVSAGFSASLGFIHTGKMTSFVYDIADLYKTETSLPAAFSATKEGTDELESRVRRESRDMFRRTRMLKLIVPDIEYALGLRTGKEESSGSTYGEPTPALWDPTAGAVEGGKDYSTEDNNGACDDCPGS
jgi:CRISPR-associated protein Cas1